MDELTQGVFLTIELDTSTLLQSANDAKQVIDSLKAKQKELNDTGQSNTVAYQQVSAQIREATGSLRDINKEIDNTTKANKAANDSLTGMKANLSLLTKSYNDLSAEQRNNNAIGGELQKKIKSLSDELKTNESALGDNRRNVGNYAEGLGAALNASTLFGGGVAEMATKFGEAKETLTALVLATSGLSETQKAASAANAAAALREAEANAAAAATEIEKASAAKVAAVSETELMAAEELATAAAIMQGEANEGLIVAQKGVTEATAASSTGFNKLKIAIASTGIGLIVLAIISLISYFKETKQGAALFSEAMAGLKAIFNALLQPIIAIGEWLVKAFKDPKQAVLDLAEAIKENITNRIVGLLELIPKLGEAMSDVFEGKFSEAAKVAADAILKVTTGVENATDKIEDFANGLADSASAAFELEKAAIELKEAQRDVNVETSKNVALVKELMIQSKNKTLADDERIEKLKQASDLETENSQKAIALAQKELENLQATNALKAKGRELTEEEADKEAEALIKINNLRGESAELQDKILNKQDALQKEMSDKAIKAAEDAEKAKQKIEDDAQKTLEQRLKDREDIEKILVADSIKGTQEEVEAKTALLRAQANKELAQKDITNAQKMLIEKNYPVAVQALADEYIKHQQDLAKQELKQAQDLATSKADIDRIELAKKINDAQAEATQEFKEGMTSYKEYIRDLHDIDIQAAKDTVDIKAKELRDLAALEKSGSVQEEKLLLDAQKLETQANIKYTKDIADADKALTVEKIKNQQDILKVSSDVFGTLAGLFQKGTEAYKIFASAQVVASTASGAMGAFSQATLTYPPPLGSIMGAAEAAVIIAAGAENLAKINKLEDGGLIYPKAQRGIIIGGEPHSRGGTKFVGSDGTRFEAEKDELLAVVNKRSVGMIGKLNALNMVNGNGNNFFGNGGLKYLSDGGFASRSVSSPVIRDAANNSQLRNLLLSLPHPIVTVEDINSAQTKKAIVQSKSTL